MTGGGGTGTVVTVAVDGGAVVVAGIVDPGSVVDGPGAEAGHVAEGVVLNVSSTTSNAC